MFKWLRRPASETVWNVAPSPDHAYVVFGDAGLPAHVAPAIADLEASFAAKSRAFRADLDDPNVEEELDDDGRVRLLIAEHLRVETVADVEAARRAAADPAALAGATHAVRVGARDDEFALDRRMPDALLGVAAAIARAANGCVADTLGLRIVPADLIADPLRGFDVASIGAHVSIVPMTDPDGTLRFTTIGFAKYGLFDVTLGGVPPALPRAYALVAAFAQAMAWDSPTVAGPWEQDVCFACVDDANHFDARVESLPKTLRYVRMRALAIPGESRMREIAGEKRPFDPGGMSAALQTFDADRAAAGNTVAARPSGGRR